MCYWPLMFLVLLLLLLIPLLALVLRITPGRSLLWGWTQVGRVQSIVLSLQFQHYFFEKHLFMFFGEILKSTCLFLLLCGRSLFAWNMAHFSKIGSSNIFFHSVFSYSVIVSFEVQNLNFHGVQCIDLFPFCSLYLWYPNQYIMTHKASVSLLQGK